MTKLSATIAKLAAMRRVTAAPANAVGASRLRDLEGFGANPGALVARIHAPSQLGKRPALVVVLHGCTQTAGGYDHGSGWSRLADEQGFVCLFPEQQRTNNPNLCFNWFSPADNRRDRGEPLSIRQMIDATVVAYDIDPSRVFVTGLSAGGAMTSVMLASYPELFAGGAIIAGLPHGSADNVQQALQAMRDPGAINAKQLGDLVRKASRHEGSWPRISIWHGSADQTVSSKNADAILAQWLSVHDLDPTTAATEMIGQHRRRVWKDGSGRPLVEDVRIANMAMARQLRLPGRKHAVARCPICSTPASPQHGGLQPPGVCLAPIKRLKRPLPISAEMKRPHICRRRRSAALSLRHLRIHPLPVPQGPALKKSSMTPFAQPVSCGNRASRWQVGEADQSSDAISRANR